MIGFFTGTALGRNMVAAGAMLIALLATAGALMRAGANREKAKTLKREIKAHEVRNEVDHYVDQLADPKRMLKSKWMRRDSSDLP
jgi:hypothetical protein